MEVRLRVCVVIALSVVGWVDVVDVKCGQQADSNEWDSIETFTFNFKQNNRYRRITVELNLDSTVAVALQWLAMILDVPS